VSDKRTYVLNVLNRGHAVQAVKVAPEGYVCDVGPPKRTLLQNDRMHACLTDIIKSGHKLHGETYTDVDDWKTFFVSVWMGETGRAGKLVKGINGEFVQLYWRTSRMNKEQLGEMMIIIERFCAENGIPLRDPRG
jgi:hypothetical protein